MLLEHCNLSLDELDQTWQAILACSQSHVLNFIGNSDKLPTNLEYSFGDRKISLELTWNTVVDDNDEIQHILVTLLDVTEEQIAKSSRGKESRV